MDQHALSQASPHVYQTYDHVENARRDVRTITSAYLPSGPSTHLLVPDIITYALRCLQIWNLVTLLIKRSRQPGELGFRNLAWAAVAWVYLLTMRGMEHHSAVTRRICLRMYVP
jgi:hypothetical protein